MRLLKKILTVLLVIIGLGIVALYVTGNSHVLNGIGKTYLIGKSKPDIDDMKYFEVSDIQADKPEAWAMHQRYNLMALPPQYNGLLDSLETTAFLVFRNDSLLFEKYWSGADEKTLSNSFSMAKSFTAILIGIAIDEGYIRDLDQPVSDFIPEFNEGMNARLTIRHLLQMASGIPFGESYASPLGYMAKAYYGKDLEEETMKFRVEKEPGTYWVYEGGNSVLLGMILKKATGRTVSEYFFQKVWSCIGAEHEAHWNLDTYKGLEKTFSGFYASARDFARIGKLYMHEGVWEHDTIVNPDFVRQCIAPNGIPDEHGESCSWYGLHWWLGESAGKKFFSCRGMRGQYIICVPDDNLIIVRLGHQQSKERVGHMPPDMQEYIRLARILAGIDDKTPTELNR